jgi:hypothetical protein
MLHHVDHLKNRFYVVTVVSNHVRYRSRWDLYKKFAQHIKEAGGQLLTVECVLGNRKFELTEPNNPWHLQLRTWDEIWHKENMINLGIQKLPPDWKYVAWIDADVHFHRKDWIEETIQQLQHYRVVQMFQTAIDLGPDGSAINTHNGFAYSYWANKPYVDKYYPNWHPGYAWAMDHETFDQMGCLIDRAVLGAGDRHMALSYIGKGQASLNKNLHPHYHSMVADWEERAAKYVRRDMGFVPGTILHAWHGKKKDRKYAERWEILVENQYSPWRDLKPDWQGLYQLVDHGDRRSLQLRDDIRRYFRSRNEDSIDLA